MSSIVTSTARTGARSGLAPGPDWRPDGSSMRMPSSSSHACATPECHARLHVVPARPASLGVEHPDPPARHGGGRAARRHRRHRPRDPPGPAGAGRRTHRRAARQAGRAAAGPRGRGGGSRDRGGLRYRRRTTADRLPAAHRPLDRRGVRHLRGRRALPTQRPARPLPGRHRRGAHGPLGRPDEHRAGQRRDPGRPARVPRGPRRARGRPRRRCSSWGSSGTSSRPRSTRRCG